MHLVDEQVVDRVGDVAHVLAVARGGPGPGPGVRGALHEDVLGGGAGAADAVDAGLHELRGLGVGGHVVGLVVAVEDHVRVVRELGRQVGPEGLEVRGGRDDAAVVAGVVVGVQHRVLASVRDVLDDGGEVGKVVGVERGGHGALGNTLHEEWDAEHVHSHVHERLNSTGVGEDIVGAVGTRDGGCSKLSTRLAGPEEEERPIGAGTARGDTGGRGGSSREAARGGTRSNARGGAGGTGSHSGARRDGRRASLDNNAR